MSNELTGPEKSMSLAHALSKLSLLLAADLIRGDAYAKILSESDLIACLHEEADAFSHDEETRAVILDAIELIEEAK